MSTFNEQAKAEIEELFSRVKQGRFVTTQQAVTPYEDPIGPGQINPVGFIAQGALSQIDLFADDIRPPVVVDALPALPDDLYPQGSFAFLTTDQKLYRNTDGSTWSAAVAASDLTGHIGIPIAAADPTLPDADYPAGSYYWNSVSLALRKTTDGLTWGLAIDANDIVARTITAGKIAVATITGTEIDAETITADNILGNTITAGQMSAGAIGANELAATIILASVIKTASSGTRVEIGTDGINFFDSSDELRVSIPTDDSEAFFRGSLHASALLSDAATLAGASSLPIDSILTLREGVSSPDVYAYQSYTNYTLEFPAVNSGEVLTGPGYYDAAGGSDGATACYVGVVQYGGVSYVVEWKMSDQQVDRVTALPTALSATFVAITRIGTSWYVVGNVGAGAVLYKFTRTTGAANGSLSIEADFTTSIGMWPISTDGTDLYVAGSSSSGNVRVVKYNTSLVKQSTLELTSEPAGAEEYRWGFVTADIGSGLRHFLNFGDTYGAANSMYEFNASTGAVVGNTQWESQSGDQLGGTYWDGTNFFARRGYYLYKYSNWTWTTASPIYWVGGAWHDSAGTTHETAAGTFTSITMRKRSNLIVTIIGGLPGAGGADDPNGWRAYILPNATLPAHGALKLQATTSGAGPVTLTTYNSGGAADGAGTPFPSAEPAYIASELGDWFLAGDGTNYFTTLAAEEIAVDFLNVGSLQDIYAIRTAAKSLQFDADAAGAALTLVDFKATALKQNGTAVSLLGHGAADHADMTRYIWLPAALAFLDSATYVDYTTAGRAIRTVNYANAATQGASWTFALPADYGSGMTFQPFWAPSATDGTSHRVRWVVNRQNRGAGNTITAAGDYVNQIGASAARTVAVIVEDSTIALTVAPSVNVVNIDLQRLGADGSDDYAGDARLVGILVAYTANQ